MSDNPAPQPPKYPIVDAFSCCAVELEVLPPEDRGRVLRALVELYRKDFERKQDNARAVLGQLTAQVHTDWQTTVPPKYGSGTG